MYVHTYVCERKINIAKHINNIYTKKNPVYCLVLLDRCKSVRKHTHTYIHTHVCLYLLVCNQKTLARNSRHMNSQTNTKEKTAV